MNELALFAGGGGGLLASRLLGWRTVCAVEIEPFCREILMRRQDEGYLEAFPIWDDVRTFDGTSWRGKVDIVTGGFPCQDVSAAGKKAGIDGPKSGLWREMLRVVREIEPGYVFMENSPDLTRRGLDRVLRELAVIGYDAEWGVLGASDIGAPHRRWRIWILASMADTQLSRVSVGRRTGDFGPHTDRPQRVRSNDPRKLVGASESLLANTNDPGPTVGREVETGRGIPWGSYSLVADATKLLRDGCDNHGQRGAIPQPGNSDGENRSINDWWEAEPKLGRVADGVADRVDRLKAIGNGQVPAVAAIAFTILKERTT